MTSPTMADNPDGTYRVGMLSLPSELLIKIVRALCDNPEYEGRLREAACLAVTCRRLRDVVLDCFHAPEEGGLMFLHGAAHVAYWASAISAEAARLSRDGALTGECEWGIRECRGLMLGRAWQGPTSNAS